MLKLLGKFISGAFRVIVGLAAGMGGTRFLLAIGTSFVIASFTFLLDGPLLFRITLFIGVFILAFVGTGRFLRWLSNW